MKRVLLFSVLAFLLPRVVLAENDTVAPETFQFVERNGKPLLMDVYHPVHPRPDSACIVYMFGGGFVVGARDEEYNRNYCQALVKHGFTVVAVDYRLHLKEVDFDTVTLLTMQRVFRDAINIAASDGAAAVAYLYKNAAAWGVARNRVILVGTSAGAISVLQLDYCRANSFPPASELPKDFIPAAVVAYSGAVYAEGGRPHYATPPAPTFFLHGTADKIVNYKKFPPVLRNGLYGVKKLQKIFLRNDYPHWIMRFDGIGHEVATLPIYTIPEFVAFVDATLSGRRMFYDATVRDNNVVPTEWSRMNVLDLYNGE